MASVTVHPAAEPVGDIQQCRLCGMTLVTLGPGDARNKLWPAGALVMLDGYDKWLKADGADTCIPEPEDV